MQSLSPIAEFAEFKVASNIRMEPSETNKIGNAEDNQSTSIIVIWSLLVLIVANTLAYITN